jgi:hypothetical protein
VLQAVLHAVADGNPTAATATATLAQSRVPQCGLYAGVPLVPSGLHRGNIANVIRVLARLLPESGVLRGSADTNTGASDRAVEGSNTAAALRSGVLRVCTDALRALGDVCESITGEAQGDGPCCACSVVHVASVGGSVFPAVVH